MIRMMKSFQVAFGCSIRYSWAFRCRYLERIPRNVYSMYRCFLCLHCAWRSADLSAPPIHSMSWGHPLSTFFFVRCRKFMISSPSPRTQCYTSILCQNLFRPSESLVKICSRVAAQVLAFSLFFHTTLLLVLTVEKRKEGITNQIIKIRRWIV